MLVNTSQDSKEIQRSDEQSIKTLHNHNPNKQKSSKHVLLEKSAPSALLPQGQGTLLYAPECRTSDSCM